MKMMKRRRRKRKRAEEILNIASNRYTNNSKYKFNEEEEEVSSWFLKYKNEANLTIEQSNKLDLLQRKQLDSEIIKVFNDIIIAGYNGSNTNLIGNKGKFRINLFPRFK
ncbi:hypothetical protein ACTA71_010421 [Dictyostelium dimigraforme]